MIISWEAAVEELRKEVITIKNDVVNAPFNSDFCHRMHMAKVALADITARIAHTENMARVEADAIRGEINSKLHEMYSITSELRTIISEINLRKAQRNRDNYLHMEALKRKAEEGGAE